MDEQKRKAITDLIEVINDLNLSSIVILGSGANMLRAKEKMESKEQVSEVISDIDLQNLIGLKSHIDSCI